MKKSSLILGSVVFIIFGICAFIFIGNSTSDECVKIKNFPARSKTISEFNKGENGYFPLEIYDDKGIDAFKVDWYVKYLKAAKEKSLLDISDKNLEIYPFTWLRTFHHPIIVRIEKQKDKISVFFKLLDGDSRREPDKFVTNKKNSIGEKD